MNENLELFTVYILCECVAFYFWVDSEENNFDSKLN